MVVAAANSGSSDMTEIELRAAATRATVAHYQGRAFEWGRVDCAKMVAWHLRQLRGLSMGLSKAGSYSSALGARRALGRLGYASLPDVLDAKGFERIAPAMAITGDIFMVAGTDDWPALVIATGNNTVLGFHEDSEVATVIRIPLANIESAWRA
ncbi:hypothetical protein GO308_12895 [Sphingomonas sp. SFZ2018-12]|uniref:DUF6950 family protein n=1 Tax=Sphingomonas sp. SFZ2018-12 TaxID=2683197 RepID=UPI001F0F5492|nr:hypothetical protein [Sphingomonas sp. SFZ2018-12]MCH4894013.1 hypothetical protein [Sphingomonas sp. SFZ2018-12]